jgi:hypothetical protein
MATAALAAWLAIMSSGHDRGQDSGEPGPGGNLRLVVVLLGAVLIGAAFFALFR